MRGRVIQIQNFVCDKLMLHKIARGIFRSIEPRFITEVKLCIFIFGQYLSNFNVLFKNLCLGIYKKHFQNHDEDSLQIF